MAGCGVERRVSAYTPEHKRVGSKTLQETRNAIYSECKNSKACFGTEYLSFPPFSANALRKFKSLTSNALERGWKAPYEFPFCPQNGGNLKSYFEAIELGEEIAIGKGYSFFVTEKAMNMAGTTICLKTLSESGVKQFGVMTIAMEDGWFIHEGRSYFQEDGQEKYFTIAKGKEWTGGDVFDDFC